MWNNFLLLFFEFAKVGLFAFGGGYASLPFLYQMIENYSWFTLDQLTQMIAISGITPGPVGFNMATFAGFKTLGFFGALTSSFALVLPMIIVTGLVFRFYLKFSNSACVKKVLYVLRPTSCALIASVGLKLFCELILKNDFSFRNVDVCALVLLLILLFLSFKKIRDPLIYITICSVIGGLLSFVNFI